MVQCPSVRPSVPSMATAVRFTSAAGARAQQQAGSVSGVVRGGSRSDRCAVRCKLASLAPSYVHHSRRRRLSTLL